MTIEKVESYCYNGKLYESLDEAERAQSIDNLRAFLEFHHVGHSWDTERFLTHLCENFEKYISLLNKLY